MKDEKAPETKNAAWGEKNPKKAPQSPAEPRRLALEALEDRIAPNLGWGE